VAVRLIGITRTGYEKTTAKQLLEKWHSLHPGEIPANEPQRHKVSKDKIKEIEGKIADIKSRWPAHSVPPSMWQQLEELEDELEKAKKAQKRG